MQSALKLNIYGIGVIVSADSNELIEKLENDFSYFKVDELLNVEKVCAYDVEKKDYQNLLPKNKVFYKQTDNSMTLDVGEYRYNDYYGKALSILDYSNESAKVYYQDDLFIHELMYILILSRTGKLLDRKGMHKVHACAVHSQDKNLIVMMPSKGGKTTMFCNLISDESIDIISDDTPLIDQLGNVLPFPLRIGHDKESFLLAKFPYVNAGQLVTFKREHFSAKYLLGLTKLKNSIKVGKKNILVQANRSTYSQPEIKSISKFKMYKSLVEHMVVGIGLPMIIEYFIRNNLKDHLVNFSIFLSRVKAAFFLVRKSENFQLYLSSSEELNNQKLLELFK